MKKGLRNYTFDKAINDGTRTEEAIKGIEDKRLMRRDLVGVWRKKNESRVFI